MQYTKNMEEKKTFDIGNRIRFFRKERGLTQEQLALSCGITTTYLGLLERNLKNPTIKILEQICCSLNITLSEFFSENLTTDFQTDTYDCLTRQIIAQVHPRSADEKKQILTILKNILKLRDL